jgi:SAM-dependent methyltransferase
MTERGYAFAGEPDEAERARILLLEAWGDPPTIRRLETIGPLAGWRCAEVGAGGGSIARWLAARVGPAGAVVACDIDLRFLTGLPPNVHPRRHDIAREDLEPGHFDLVHCRTLLMHLTEPRAALTRMVSALKPGGWLLAEDADWGLCTIGGHADAAWATCYLRELGGRHADADIRNPFFGRTLPGLVAELGLERVGGDLTAPVLGHGDASLELIRRTVRSLRAASLSVGGSEEDLDRLEAVLASPSIVVLGMGSVGVGGRKPA